MKKKTKKTGKTPRYITIRIQYYPLNNKFVYSCFILFFITLFGGSTHLLGSIWTTYPFVSHVLAADTFQLSYVSTIEEAPVQQDEYVQASLPQPTSSVISHGPRDRKAIALTFDADMTPSMKSQLDSGEVVTYYDTKVINILNETQTKATIFFAGMWIETYLDATKEIAANPLFELANHSYSHPSFDGNCFGLGEVPDEQDKVEIQKTQALLQSVGVTNSYFRFPGGCYSQKDLDIMKDEGLSVVHWDVIGHDGFNHDGYVIENNIVPHVQNGSIIVLHLGGAPNTPKTAEVLPTIISKLKEKGFEFVKVSELLNQKPTSQAIIVQEIFSF